jgi:hypothetical protein
MRTFVAILLIFLAAPSLAQECTCNPITESPKEWVHSKYQASKYVFLGQVASLEPPFLEVNEVHDIPTVRVLHSYKGQFPGGKVRPSDCGPGVPFDVTYMFFLDDFGRMKSCSVGVRGLTLQQIQSAVEELSRHGP